MPDEKIQPKSMTVLDYAKRYLSLGLNVIPVRRDLDPDRDKRPVLSRWEQYQRRMATEAEISDWFAEGKNNNIAVICGSISSNLAVIDFDDPRAFAFVFRQGIEALSDNTPVALTGKGVHVYVKVKKSFAKTTYQKKNKDQKNWIPVDIQCEGSYVVAPPSLHLRKEKTYTFVKEPKGFIETTEENLKADFEKAAEQWPIVVKFIGGSPDENKWSEGNRHNKSLGLAGFLRKRMGYSEEDAILFVEKLCNAAGDDEVADRLRAVQDAYAKDENSIAIGTWLGEEFTAELEKSLPKKKKPKKTAPEREGSVMFPITTSKSVEWSPDGIRIITVTPNGGSIWEEVIQGYIKPCAELDIDGDVLFEYELRSKKINSKTDDMISLLKSLSMVIQPNNALGALSKITKNMIKEIRVGHATFGVYSEKGILIICDSPLPTKNDQEKLQDIISPLIETKLTSEDLQNYINMMKYWHPYEFLPSFGLGMIAPFAFTLRTLGILIPYDFCWSPEHDLGKSKSRQCATSFLWGTPPESGQSMQSEFRFCSLIDSICLPILLDEGELIKPELFPSMKQAAESANANRRGTKELEIVKYNSRAVLLFTSNSQPITAPETLKRFFITRFDSTRSQKPMEVQKEFELAYRKLKPIGYDVLRAYVKAHQTLNGFIEEIRRYESQFRKWQWKSAKRPEMWAVVYLGLKIFEHSCEKNGINWRVPEIDTFYETVVTPVEISTWGSSRSVVEVFTNWFEYWRIQNTRYLRGVDGEPQPYVQGEGEIFKEDVVYVGALGDVPGHWVTAPLLDSYNKSTKNNHEVIPKLNDLAVQVADFYSIPRSTVVDTSEKEIKAKVVKIGKRTSRAAFVPDPSYFIQHPGVVKEKILDDFGDNQKPTPPMKENNQMPIPEGVPIGLPPMTNPQIQNPPPEPMEASKPEEIMETTTAPKNGSPEVDISLKNDISIQQTSMPDSIPMPEKATPKPDNGNKDDEKIIPEGYPKAILDVLADAVQLKLNPPDEKGMKITWKDEFIKFSVKYIQDMKKRGKTPKLFFLRQDAVAKFPGMEDEVAKMVDSGFSLIEAFATGICQFKERKSVDPKLLEKIDPKLMKEMQGVVSKTATKEIEKEKVGTTEKETSKQWTEKFKKL